MHEYCRWAPTLPIRVVPNSYFNELLGEDVDTWLRENVQIYERRWCSENESTADLCEAAARQALERAGIAPEKAGPDRAGHGYA